MKEQLLSLARTHVEELVALQRAVKAIAARRVSRRQPLDDGAKAARNWFDVMRPALEKAQFRSELIDAFSRRFEDLLRAAGGEPTKEAYLQAVNGILSIYREQIVHQIEIGSFSHATGLSIAPYIEGLPVAEGDYLDEAQRCLSVDALRGCIVLGWCATISRVHDKIEELGFDKFNKATEEMSAKTVGRFKPYNKKFAVASISELQRVFDTELLWVLEYMELIDGNQHQRLRHCFDMRNHSAHPGLAPISGENLYSFFSDITKFVLKSPKFELRNKGSD